MDGETVREGGQPDSLPSKLGRVSLAIAVALAVQPGSLPSKLGRVSFAIFGFGRNPKTPKGWPYISPGWSHVSETNVAQPWVRVITVQRPSQTRCGKPRIAWRPVASADGSLLTQPRVAQMFAVAHIRSTLGWNRDTPSGLNLFDPMDLCRTTRARAWVGINERV